MEKAKSSLKTLKIHTAQKLHRPKIHVTSHSAVCQSIAAQSDGHPFQKSGYHNLHQGGNTCSEGRRLQELRLRCLARKFFCLWAQKTFGQVLPSKISAWNDLATCLGTLLSLQLFAICMKCSITSYLIRCYCDQKILQKTSGEWKEEWWIACREKKLIFRADCHYRYFLYQLVFKTWRAFICQQQQKRNKNHVAELHANKQKLLWTWQRWLIYVDVRRTKHRMQAVALAFRERSCLRVSWAAWRRRHYQNCAGRKMKVLALQHWAQSLQFRAWLQWRALYLYSQNEKQEEARAVTHHRHWQLKTSMGAWLRYLNLQRAKRRQKEVAQEHHQGRIVQRYFSGWRLLWECRRRVHAHQKHFEKLAAKLVLWRVFARWKHYVVLRVEEAWQRELAEKHHRHHLLRLGFKGLRHNVLNARSQQMRKNLAYRQHQVTVLQSFWNRWKSRLEEKEEEQQQTLTSVAQTHYRKMLVRKAFDMWWLRACKQQEYRVEEKRVQLTLCSKFITSCEFNKAVLHFERQLLLSCWCFWRRRANALLEEQEDLLRAGNHYSYVLLFKAFCLWKQITQERKTQRLKEMQAESFHYSKCLQQSWNKWREYVEHQREKWKKLVQADIHYQHVLLGKALAAWKSYQQNVQCILYQVAEKEKQHCRLLLQQLLHIWRENALEAKAASQADQHYRRVILSKVLLQWKDAASLKVHYRQQKQAAVKEAVKHLNIARLQNLFLHWKEVTAESLVLRAKQDRAVQHHQQHLLQKYLGNWKKYHEQHLEKALLQRRGYQLMTTRLCSACFSYWKKELVQQQWEKRETARALWHWCLSLQGKVFSAWLGFVQEQQRKKKLLERAVGVRRAALLKEGVTRTVRHTAGLERSRRQLRVQHQPKAIYSLPQSVHRCAMLWKQKALCKHLNKPSTPLLPLNKQGMCKVPDINPGTRGCSVEEAPWPSQSSRSPFLLAAGDSILSELNVLRRARLPPRRPDFLLESLEREELLGMTCTRSETPSQRAVMNKCSTQAGHLLLATQMEESICNQLSRAGCDAHAHSSPVLPSVPAWPDNEHHANEHHAVPFYSRPGLWPPSSFMPQMKAEAKKRGGQPVDCHTEAHSQESQQGPVGKKLQPNLQPHLLSPEDFMGKQSHRTAAKEEESKHNSRREEVFQRELEAELLSIQQQMQYYFSRKQELKSCQQQAQILQKWLETSTQPEDQDAIQEVQAELHQLEMRINTLTKAQLKDRHHVEKLVARLQDIHSALEM